MLYRVVRKGMFAKPGCPEPTGIPLGTEPTFPGSKIRSSKQKTR
jgi:hypothetical protein